MTHPAYGIVGLRFERRSGGALLESTGCYIAGETLAVDTCCAWAREAFRETLHGLGCDRTIREVVITHPHAAQTGNTALLAELCQPRLLAHHLAVSELRLPDETAAPCAACPGAMPLGERLGTAHGEFEVLHLPGHASGHVALFEPGQRWLFSSHLTVPARGREWLEADGPRWLAAVGQVLALRPAALFDGDGRLVSQENDALAVLEHVRDVLQQLSGRIADRAGQARSLQDLDRRVFADPAWLPEEWRALAAAPAEARQRFVRTFLRDLLAPVE